MKEIFVTITGTSYRYGTEFLKEDMIINLHKEPDNEYDKEAIEATIPALGRIGYVANSVHTVIGECISAGRLYDKIGDTAVARVMYIFPSAVVCRVEGACLTE